MRKQLYGLQSILVKYLGPTNTQGSRYKASAAAGSITKPRNYELSNFDDARVTAIELCHKLDWVRAGFELVGGTLPDGNYSFVIFYNDSNMFEV